MRALAAALGHAMVYDWKRHVQGHAAAARGSIASMMCQKRARQVDEEEVAAANNVQQASDPRGIPAIQPRIQWHILTRYIW